MCVCVCELQKTCLPMCVHISPIVSHFLHPSIPLFIHNPSVHSYVCVSICLSVCLSVCLSLSLSLCLCVCLSFICLSVLTYLSVRIYTCVCAGPSINLTCTVVFVCTHNVLIIVFNME